MSMTDIATELTGDNPEIDDTPDDVNLEGANEGGQTEPEENPEIPDDELPAYAREGGEEEQPAPQGAKDGEGEELDTGDQGGGEQPLTVEQQLEATRAENERLSSSIHNMENRFNQAVNMFQQRLAQPQPQQPLTLQQKIDALGKRPDPFQQPDEYEAHLEQVQALRDADYQEKLNALDSRVKSQEQERQFNQQLNQVTSAIEASEQQARAQHPEYDQSLAFMRSKYAESQRAAGRVGSDEQFLREAMQHEVMIAAQAILQGRDPASLVLGAARQNGFVYQGKTDPSGDPDPNNPEIPNAGKLAKIEQGQQRNRMGKQSAGKPSLQTMADQSDDEFSQAMNLFMEDINFDM